MSKINTDAVPDDLKPIAQRMAEAVDDSCADNSITKVRAYVGKDLNGNRVIKIKCEDAGGAEWGLDAAPDEHSEKIGERAKRNWSNGGQPTPEPGDKVKCPDCGGTGQKPPEQYQTGRSAVRGRSDMDCPTCGGIGEARYVGNGNFQPVDR